MTHDSIVTIEDRKGEKFLRQKPVPFMLSAKSAWAHEGKALSRAEVSKLLQHMKKIMRGANGVGLSANQIGFTYRLFVAQVPSDQGESKFYAVFNPEIEKMDSESETTEEGCLSVPGIYGAMPRAKRVVLRGWDKNGKPLKIKAWGLLARVFQHEVDHLNGKLFIDKAKHLERMSESERLKSKHNKLITDNK